MAVSSASSGASPSPLSSRQSRIALFFLLISALYFADTLLRTTLKTFWYDELVTVYLCRLPSFHATWTAVLHGADLNPPLFYLLTRWAQHFSGEGLIATRLPAILGFWIFGACLYLFVARRLGPVCGCIAALAPWFTLADYYAYEARPHGAVLAWCGLMLVSWQWAREPAPSAKWRSALCHLVFFLSFLAGLLTHVYAVFLAVPFALVELDSLLHRKPVRIPTCIALALAPCLVAPLYLRLTHIYTSGIAGGIHQHPYEIVQQFVLAVFGPTLILLILLLALLAWRRSQAGISDHAAMSLRREELVASIGFLLLPVLGVVAAKVTHGPYFNRYFLAVTAGFAVLLAQAVAPRSGRRPFLAPALAAIMLFLLVSDTLIAGYCHWRHADLDLSGPSNLIIFGPNPAQPFLRNDSLLHDTSQLDILVDGHPDYLFFQYYASPALRHRLIYAAPDPSEEFLAGYRLLSHWTGTGLQTTTFADYFVTHHDFLLYEANRDDCPACMQAILAAGYSLRSIRRDVDGKLEHFSK